MPVVDRHWQVGLLLGCPARPAASYKLGNRAPCISFPANHEIVVQIILTALCWKGSDLFELPLSLLLPLKVALACCQTNLEKSSSSVCSDAVAITHTYPALSGSLSLSRQLAVDCLELRNTIRSSVCGRTAAVSKQQLCGHLRLSIVVHVATLSSRCHSETSSVAATTWHHDHLKARIGIFLLVQA